LRTTIIVTIDQPDDLDGFIPYEPHQIITDIQQLDLPGAQIIAFQDRAVEELLTWIKTGHNGLHAVQALTKP
jgi:hypothetical protein